MKTRTSRERRLERRRAALHAVVAALSRGGGRRRGVASGVAARRLVARHGVNAPGGINGGGVSVAHRGGIGRVRSVCMARRNALKRGGRRPLRHLQHQEIFYQLW